MTLGEASQIVANYDNAAKSGAYLDWNLEQLLGVQKQLREAREVLRAAGYHLETGETALAKLNQAIEMKRLEERTERHQKENVGWSKRILFWAKWTFAAALLVPIAVALIQEIPFSKLLPAKASQSPIPSPEQSPLPVETPEKASPPSESPTMSPIPLAAATPK